MRRKVFPFCYDSCCDVRFSRIAERPIMIVEWARWSRLPVRWTRKKTWGEEDKVGHHRTAQFPSDRKRFTEERYTFFFLLSARGESANKRKPRIDGPRITRMRRGVSPRIFKHCRQTMKRLRDALTAAIVSHSWQGQNVRAQWLPHTSDNASRCSW